jgi:hypothetical protein
VEVSAFNARDVNAVTVLENPQSIKEQLDCLDINDLDDNNNNNNNQRLWQQCPVAISQPKDVRQASILEDVR